MSAHRAGNLNTTVTFSMNDDDNPLVMPFPSPPGHYSNYTSHNLNLFQLLESRRTEAEEDDVSQRTLLMDQDNVPDWPLESLEKPRVDWILEEGYYKVFGDTWFVRASHYYPSVSMMNIYLLKDHRTYSNPRGGRRHSIVSLRPFRRYDNAQST